MSDPQLLQLKAEVLDLAPCPLALLTRELEVRYVNRSLAELLGYREEELLGRSGLDFVKEPERALQAARETLRRGRWSGELPIRRGDESTLTVGVSGHRLESDGEVVLAATLSDDSEMRRLQLLVGRHEAALATAREVVFCCWERLGGERHPETLISSSIQELLGMEPQAVAEEPDLWQRCLHPADRTEAVERLREATEGQVPDVFTYRLRNLDNGRYHWVTETVMPYPAKSPRGMVGALRDVTEERSQELERARLQDLVWRAGREWEMTFDSIDHPILLIDAGGRLRRVNRAARDALGADFFPDVLGLRLSEYREQPWTSLARAVAVADPPPEGEHSTFVDVESNRIWRIALYAARPAGQGTRPWLVATIRDVTYEEALERSLTRARTMTAMGELVSGVAHEVRNPLFGISAVLDALDEERGDDEEVRPFVSMLRHEVQRMQVLMEGLLDYGRPVPENRSRAPLAPLLERAVDACRPLATHRVVELEMEAPADLPEVPMDSRSLETALKNLVENAVQHSPLEGRVRVAAVAVEGGVRVEVADSGPGFDAALAEHYTEPFFSRREGGTGLGLAIVQRVADAHGARLVLETCGEGGRVSLVLPQGTAARGVGA